MKRKLDQGAEGAAAASADVEEDEEQKNQEQSNGGEETAVKGKGKSKKKKLNPIGKLPDTQSTKEQLLHKNRELAVKARRLREKLKKSNSKLQSLGAKAQTFDDSLSCVTRALDALVAEGLSLLGEKLDVKLDPAGSGYADMDKEAVASLGKPSSPEDFARMLLGRQTHDILSRRVSEAVLNAKADDDDDDDDDDGEGGSNSVKRLLDLPSLVDKEVSRKSKLALALLRAIVERLLGVGANPDRERAVKSLLGSASGAEAAELRAKLRAADERCKLFADRILHLETQARKLQDQTEDAEIDQRTWMHRLAAVCTESLHEGTLGSTVEVLKEKGVMKQEDLAAASSSNASARQSQGAAAADSKDAQDEAARQSEEKAEANEAEELASERLREIEQILEEKKKLIDELERLRAEFKQQETAATAAGGAARNGAGVDARAVEDLEAEVNRLKAQLDQTTEAESKEREMVQTVRRTMAQLETTTAETLAQHTQEYARQVKEAEAKFIAQLGDLEQAKVDQEKLLVLEKQLEEYKIIAQTRQTELNAARTELKVLKESPPAKHDEALRARLEEAAKGQWPEDEEKRTAAQLRTELEAARAELGNSKESLAAVLQDLEATTSAFPEIEAQKERILHEVAAMRELSAEKSNRFIRLDQDFERAKKDLRVKAKELDELRRVLGDHDEQYRILQTQYAATEEAMARSEEYSRTTYAMYQDLAKDREAIRTRFSALDAEANGLRTTIHDLEHKNAEFRKAKEEAEHQSRRAAEQLRKVKAKLERSRAAAVPSHLNPSEAASDVELRLSAMENALRCPLRSEYWRDAVIVKCGHSFSKKALYDNLEKRNRKCPHCKALYNKQDVLDMIPPYQRNDYDD
ncbi:E3 ubiquitin-protein ligase BRE1 [Hondaea fermentalgiana]|uniref:E3 ubiquitin protein ligase n=1 Tax=Hondaea fermentalgiana TaxID=2315210 RepID=A0A2R5GCN8_9STRA|nr:E3 ubiquitin-protein ligase BRE1 [Hondaea fermentalgiana]|eukprot:GBG27478.1 E3 ubiquitin-protein ligase BRE1 [Hondaea fermentalgiana]